MEKSATSAPSPKTGAVVAATVATAVAACLAVTRLRGKKQGGRWLVVTVNTTPDAVNVDGRLDEALARFTDVETRLTPAPGLRGTEIAARLPTSRQGGLVRRAAGTDPRQELRRALRNLKSEIETGEVMRPDSPPTTGKPTPGGALVRFATRRAGGEGQL